MNISLESSKRSASAAKQIILIYVVFAGFWILVSDSVVSWLLSDPAAISQVSVAKGWLFVAVTALLLYGLIRRMQMQAQEMADRERMLQTGVADLKNQNSQLETQVALRTQEFMDLYNHAPCGYHSLSPECVVLRANQTELSLLGYAEAEFVGHRIDEFLTPESMQILKMNFPRLLNDGGVQNVEIDFVCKDGSIRPFLVDANLVRGPSGEPLYTRSTMVDNTERKAQAIQIQSLNNLLQEVIESLPYGLFVLDETRQLRLKNSRVIRLLDYPDGFFDRDQVAFSDIVRFHWNRGDYQERPFDEVLAFFVNAMVTRQIMKFERPQVNGVFLEVCIEPLSSGWTLLTYTDITAHKRAEQVLDRAMRAAEAATVAKSAFIANMSHELRTPMNAILGLSYLLDKSNLPAEASGLVHKIRKAGNSLLVILNDVLDFSKIESGKMNLQSSPFRLGDILDNLASIMSINAHDKDLELIISPVPLGASELVGDSMRLEQVLINLTGNAIKFTAHGHVTLSIRNIREDDGHITLRFGVSDSGIGIAPEKQQEIFAEFSQADGSTSRKFGGTGLGLTISRRLVEAMGGELNVSSELGCGSEFWFELRFKRIAHAILSTPAVPALSVVIADDNTTACQAMHSIVDGLGWRATPLNSGYAVLAHLKTRTHVPDTDEVLLLDFTMPGMDGLQTAHAVRHSRLGFAGLIVILVTAHTHDALRNHPHANLADAVLIKPVTPSSLYNAVSNAMRTRRGGDAQTSIQTRARLAGLRMLVVDDSEINREVALRIFANEGALMSEAENGQAALDWLATHVGAVDLVLMDVQMPLLNGYDVTRKIRGIQAFQNLPVVALTADALVQHQELARQAGMNGYLAKPFDVDKAVALILKLTGHVQATAAASMAATPDQPPVYAQDLPGMAITKALTLWQDAALYQKFLRRFADQYANIVQVLRGAHAVDAQALLHKFRGAAANLGLVDVAVAAHALEYAYQQDKVLDEQALLAFQRGMTVALDSIAQYAAPLAPMPVDAASDPNQLGPALARLLQAWQTDSSSEVEQTLAEMGHTLPAAALSLQHTALDNYDFKAGEAATDLLIRSLSKSRQEL